MTEWYYSDAQRQQHGPVGPEEMASLHTRGLLTPESLVWREGMDGWKPWREMMTEMVIGTPLQGADTATASGGLDPYAIPDPVPDDGAYRPYAIAEVSPYAPPEARVEELSNVISGGRVVYAGFWKRVAASFIDNIVITAINYAIMIPMTMIMAVGAGAAAAGDNPFASGAGMVVFGLLYLAMLLIPALYFAWMHSSGNQASLGKMAVGIKVARADGSRIGFWRAFGRYWALIPSAIILGIGYLMAAFTDRKQALHDMICDTLVVDKWAYTDRPDWQREDLGVVTIVVLVLAGLAVFGMLALFAAMFAAMSSGLR